MRPAHRRKHWPLIPPPKSTGSDIRKINDHRRFLLALESKAKGTRVGLWLSHHRQPGPYQECQRKIMLTSNACSRQAVILFVSYPEEAVRNKSRNKIIGIVSYDTVRYGIFYHHIENTANNDNNINDSSCECRFSDVISAADADCASDAAAATKLNSHVVPPRAIFLGADGSTIAGRGG